MNRSVPETVNQYTSANGRRRQWQKVVMIMAAFVVFCTTYALIMPAVTQKGQTYCGLEEHKEHTAECYKQTKTLVCGEEGHTHTADCYEEREVLVCGKEETAGSATKQGKT